MSISLCGLLGHMALMTAVLSVLQYHLRSFLYSIHCHCCVLIIVVVDFNVCCHVGFGIPFIVDAVVLIIFVVDVEVSCHVGCCIPFIVDVVFLIIILVIAAMSVILFHLF